LCRISFGAAVNLSGRAASPAFVDERDLPVAAHDETILATLPSGTKINVRTGPFKGRSGRIVKHAGLDFYKVQLKWVRKSTTIRAGEFKVI
jgi:hypothetical protein